MPVIRPVSSTGRRPMRSDSQPQNMVAGNSASVEIITSVLACAAGSLTTVFRKTPV